VLADRVAGLPLTIRWWLIVWLDRAAPVCRACSFKAMPVTPSVWAVHFKKEKRRHEPARLFALR